MQAVDRYLKLFSWYGFTAEDFYRREGIEPQTEQLFEQIAALAMADTPFNRDLPWQFLHGFRGYRQGEPSSLALFNDTDRRAFFLSDFYDYLQLKRRGLS